MKLKYYLRGMGIGIILTAIVMGFALGGRKATISDAEVIERAKALGMVDPNSGVLSQPSGGANNYEEETTVTSGEKLDQKGEEVSQEINEIVAPTSEPISGLDQTSSEGEEKNQTAEGESSEEVDQASTEGTSESKPARSPEGLASSTSSETASDNEGNITSDQSSSDADNTDETKSEETTDDSTTNTQVKAEETSDNSASNATKKVSGKTFVIPKGLSSDGVASLLYEQGFVDNARNFNQYLIDRKMDRIIRSGEKTIPDGASYEDIAVIICK